MSSETFLKHDITDIVDAHHHFYSPDNDFNILQRQFGLAAYLPEQYASEAVGLPIFRTVHVEAAPAPGSGAAEAAWVESLTASGRGQVAAIVGSCNLADKDADAQLDALAAAAAGRLRGIRWLLDWDGPREGDGDNATHPAVALRQNCDYLRDPEPAAAFEKGYALLAQRNLSFDLQCAPAQLPAAAALCAQYPTVKVVINHIGKPRHLMTKDAAYDAAELARWRMGMAAMAALSHVYVKLSMLGYAVPNWHKDKAKEELLKTLVLEMIALFGANRCMFATNWHTNAAVSDGDGVTTDGLDIPALYTRFAEWTAKFSPKERQRLFSGTAAEFYRL
ncbi:hypothetical protein CYMTET_44109 [Cymbomonas tetramitiformis]|uniref:Amidohydrolase-related domain-containing protein n=1 Tax=Cymbomonas tetramitiformis TaxID=36881 RepID=A0AAE0F000_9CHLO|nr:hypothetical protein CYMTET_44109 [Cymbomonas tetramitiformis]